MLYLLLSDINLKVYLFVRKATQAVIPKAFWGCHSNFNVIMKRRFLHIPFVSTTLTLSSDVELFIKLRRWETINLHSVLQNFSIQECDWLLPLNPRARQQRATASDAFKRGELLEEFFYWYFDSFVIPLIRVIAIYHSTIITDVALSRHLSTQLIREPSDNAFSILGWTTGQAYVGLWWNSSLKERLKN